MKRWPFSVAFFFAIAIPIWGFAAKDSGSFFGKSAPKNLGRVERADLARQVTVAGTVVPQRRTVITPPYNSYVKKLFVRLGDNVKDGDPVVSLVQSLRDSGTDVFPLRAPFSGSVVQVLKSEGEYVETGREGNAIVRIDDLTRLFVNSDVPEADIGKIKIGQQVLIKANAILNRAYHGVIREMALAAKEKKEWSRTGDRVDFEVKMEVIDKDARVRPGMSVIVDIITDKRTNVLALAQEYIEKTDGNYFVTLENGERRKIEVGLQNEDKFEIIKGLAEKDAVRVVDFSAMNMDK